MTLQQAPPRPRIVRVRHCTECGSALHNDILDRRETRCAYCRSMPPTPPEGHSICRNCGGRGVEVIAWHGCSPDEDECQHCRGRGHVPVDVTPRPQPTLGHVAGVILAGLPHEHRARLVPLNPDGTDREVAS